MKKLFLAAIASLSLMSANAATPTTAEQDSLSRALAVTFNNAAQNFFKSIEDKGIHVDYKAFVDDFIDVFNGGDRDMPVDQAFNFMDRYIDKYGAQKPNTFSVESQQAFIKAMAGQPGAIVTPSGLVFIIVQEGEGKMPVDSDRVSVSYTGMLSDGSVFDRTGGETVEFDVDRLVPGFTEGLKMMRPGGTYRLIIPSDLAYGPNGIPGVIPGNAVLDFVVTLNAVNP
jgi:FKBP-type peptidyl-prolyl cis-trans isomerase FkpA